MIRLKDAKLTPAVYKRNKYHAKKTTVDGITFDSKAEAKHYVQLKLLERAGRIKDIELQPQWALRVNGIHVCTYRADFSYCDMSAGGRRVFVDVKGVKTPVYRLKVKLLKALYGIVVKEITV